jgi:alcohol dehydrogenase class IV
MPEVLADTARSLFEFARGASLRMPADVRFGAACFNELPAAVRSAGGARRVFVLTGGRSADRLGLRARVTELLGGTAEAIRAHPDVSGEPTARSVDAAAARARRFRPDLVVAAGGGSVLDTAKAVAALATNPGAVEDYLEGAARRRPLARDPLPCIAAPTTAGTGTEMTRNAVVLSAAQGCKRSLRDERLLPRAALVDPALTLTLPAAVTAAGGMDAVTQLIESCLTARRTPAATELACRALRGVREALPAAVREPGDLDARTRMSLAASASGICLANAGLAMAHGIAAALGALHGVPHGVACGLLLPHTLRFNRDACEEPLAAALAAFLGRRRPAGDTIDAGIAAIEALNRDLGIPPDLTHLRLRPAEVERVARASSGSSMAGNPVPLNDAPEETLGFLLTLC